MSRVAEVVGARAALNRRLRYFFEERDFLEVETPHLVASAGTDPYLDAVPAMLTVNSVQRSMALHTSPEFAMKELLVEGLQRIYQLCHVWRDGELTPQHNPEFSLLEWYRVDEGYQAIMDDVEELVREVLGTGVAIAIDGYQQEFELPESFLRVTMRELWEESCGIDPIATAGDAGGLAAAARAQGLGATSDFERWDEWFFSLWYEAVEPWLAERGAVFVTEWPTQLAVLARNCPHDERVAERFELYIGGVELANGFGELTDAAEQRRRFEADNAERRALGKPEQPIPQRFLAALERGMPDASGVALGVDRLLMLATGLGSISEVLPFATDDRRR